MRYNKIFKRAKFEESFNAKVGGLLGYLNFQKLSEDFEISILGDSFMMKQELVTRLEQLYLKQKQEEYEALGIKVELL